MAFETLTVAQLTALRDAYQLMATGAARASGVTSYTIAGRSVAVIDPIKALHALERVDRALALRTDASGGTIDVEFCEPW